MRLLAAVVGSGIQSVRADDKITIGFVTHAQGDPFIQQIIDGAQAAANDLGVTLKVARSRAARPKANSSSCRTSSIPAPRASPLRCPANSMAKGLNEIIASGVPIVQFNLLSTAVKAPYVGEKSVQSGRILGKMVVDKLGGAAAKGKVVLGNCFPGSPCWRTAPRASRNR